MTPQPAVQKGETGRGSAVPDALQAVAEATFHREIDGGKRFHVGTTMQAMDLFIGPVIERDGGYCYETFTLSEGLRISFRYRRVEEARYDRRVLIAESAANPRCRVRECETLAEFEAAAARARAESEAAAGGLAPERRGTAV